MCSPDTDVGGNKCKRVFEFLKVKCKIRIILNKIWFNKECLRNNIVPKYARVKINNKNNVAQKVKITSEILWVKTEIKALYGQLNKLNRDVYNKYWELREQYSFIEIEEILYTFGVEYINRKVEKRKNVIKKKLERLINDNNQCHGNKNIKMRYAERVVNISGVEFNKEETEILGKGLKFAIRKRINKEEILIQCESIIGRMKEEEHKKRIRYEISNIVENMDMNKVKNRNKINAKVKILKDKIKEKELIITKADKGNTTVIMRKDEYIKKTEEFINNGPYEAIKHDYTSRNQAQVKRILKETSIFTEFEKKHFIESNPVAPIMKNQIKLHKDGRPIRPIVSFIGAPCYKLSKITSRILKEKYEFKKLYNRKNSIEVIQEIEEVKVNNNITLMSIDVKDMFTNIPSEKVIEIIKKNKMNEYQGKEQLLKIVKMCMDQNYFRFNNRFYKQNKGLPMGSSLSPILAEIYMNDFENNFMNNSKYKRNIIKWVRYVDDILIIWDGDMKEIENFVVEVNSIEPTIQFKEEIGGKEICFLDLNLRITENNKIEFDIFRKSSYTDVIIPNDSFHPIGYKMAAINSMCYRAIKCLKNEKTLKKEVNRIKNIVENNKYTRSVVDKVLKRIKKKSKEKRTDEEENSKKYGGAITYVGWETEKVRRCFKKFNIDIAVKRSKTVFDFIKNNITEDIPIIKKSGIYRIKCDECGMFYIGESGRAIECRLKDHRRGEGDRNTTSLYARHFIEKGHKFVNPIENFEVLGIENKITERRIREELEILKQKKIDENKLINIKTSFDNEDIFYYIVKKI